MCCDRRELAWGLYGSPRQWATIYCRHCRHVYQRGVPAVQAKLIRDEIAEGLCGRASD